MENEPHDSVNKLLQDITEPAQEQQPQQLNETTAENIIETEKAKKSEPVSEEVLQSGAAIAIGMFDFAQKSIFTFFTKKKGKSIAVETYGSDAEILLQKALGKVELNDELTHDEIALLTIHKNVTEIIKQLPLSNEEKEILRVPLVEIMKQKGGVLPPEYALLLAALQVVGGRTAEIFML